MEQDHEVHIEVPGPPDPLPESFRAMA